MKPFDNVAVSATEPRSKVWIKHKYVKYNGTWQNITYGENGEVLSNSKRLASDKIKLEKGVYKLDNPNNEEISPVAIAKFNDESFVELKANIKFPYELVVDDTFNQISLVFKKTNDGVITSGDVKNFEILSYENDILVKDDGVYNSVLKKSITTGQEIRTTNILDGKYVYYRRVDLGNLPNSTTKEVDTGLSNVNILKLDGIAKETFGTVIPLPFVIADTTKSVAIVFNTTTNKITITTGTDRTNFSGYANLYYTKN